MSYIINGLTSIVFDLLHHATLCIYSDRMYYAKQIFFNLKVNSMILELNKSIYDSTISYSTQVHISLEKKNTPIPFLI